MTETFQLKHGLFAVFELSEDDRAPLPSTKREPPHRCADTQYEVSVCPCPKHTAERAAAAGRLPL